MTMCKNGCGNSAESGTEYCAQHCNPKKVALDVTTKGWKKESVDKLREKILSQGMKFQVELKLKDGTTKFLYIKKPEDATKYCKQMDATIVKVEDFD
jgi:flavorubredoxin